MAFTVQKHFDDYQYQSIIFLFLTMGKKYVFQDMDISLCYMNLCGHIFFNGQQNCIMSLVNYTVLA